jgi:hypothetical protein
VLVLKDNSNSDRCALLGLQVDGRGGELEPIDDDNEGGNINNGEHSGDTEDEEDDEDDGVVDGPSVLAHTDLAKTVRACLRSVFIFLSNCLLKMISQCGSGLLLPLPLK